jgi:hypothetical protein
MKTTIIIAAKRAILIFTLFSVFQIQQVNAKSPGNRGPEKNIFDFSILAPVTPKEATFDDVVPEKAPAMVSVAPATPKEATFEDADSAPEISTEFLKKVAPETPREAEFNDPSPDAKQQVPSVIFSVPTEALFIDF